MNGEKELVITVYGHDMEIDQITVSGFDSGLNAETYRDTVNGLEPRGNSWISTKFVSRNHKYDLDSFLPGRMNLDIALTLLDDRAIRIVFREADPADRLTVLKNAAEPIKEKFFRNMSVRAARMLKEDLEAVEPAGSRNVEAARKNILALIRRLEDSGEIVLRKADRDDLVL